MGQYRFWLMIISGLGFHIHYKYKYQLLIRIMFIEIIIGLEKHARGYNILDRWIK